MSSILGILSWAADNFSVVFGGIVTVLLAVLFGINKSQKKTITKQKTENKQLADTNEKQRKVVKTTEKVGGEVKEKQGETAKVLAPEIAKATAIPKDETNHLSGTVKDLASSQAKRIQQRRKKSE